MALLICEVFQHIVVVSGCPHSAQRVPFTKPTSGSCCSETSSVNYLPFMFFRNIRTQFLFSPKGAIYQPSMRTLFLHNFSSSFFRSMMTQFLFIPKGAIYQSSIGTLFLHHFSSLFFRNMMTQFLFSPKGAIYQANFWFSEKLECGRPSPDILLQVLVYTVYTVYSLYSCTLLLECGSIE